MVQLSHLYMTTGETMALIRQTFVGKVMSLLFNMLSRFIIAFLPRSVSGGRSQSRDDKVHQGTHSAEAKPSHC